jgi:hypothetical protein
MLTEEIKKMPVKNRLILMEEIWETLESSKDVVKSPSWHYGVLEDRKDLIKEGKAKFVTIDDLKNVNK